METYKYDDGRLIISIRYMFSGLAINIPYQYGENVLYYARRRVDITFPEKFIREPIVFSDFIRFTSDNPFAELHAEGITTETITHFVGWSMVGQNINTNAAASILCIGHWKDNSNEEVPAE